MPRRPTADFAFPAPVKGLWRVGSLLAAPPDAAEVLENFIPSLEGPRIRGGASQWATLGASAKALLTYVSGTSEQLFGVTDAAIYPITAPASSTVAPTASVTGLASSDWGSVMFSNAGGDYLWIANGTDAPRHYDGTTWATPAITGVTATLLDAPWTHKSRIWAVERGTTSAWYLATNAIAGAATEFPLYGILPAGGALLFGATLSTDTGSGLDDLQAFVSTEGEVAVYGGTDPASSSTWALTGVYRIGRPLHKAAWFKVGGDVLVATEEGIVSLLGAMTKDRGALRAEALTAPIQDIWQDAMTRKSATDRFPLVVLPARSLLFLTLPTLGGAAQVLVANTLTRAWAVITGWAAACWGTFDGDAYFGTSDAAVAKADTGGKDLGATYTARWAPKHQDFGTPALKSAVAAQALWRGQTGTVPRLGCFTDYNRGAMDDGGEASEEGSAAWGVALWGAFTWGGTTADASAYREWHAVAGQGMSLAPTFSVTAFQTSAPDLTLLGIVLRYETGAAM